MHKKIILKTKEPCSMQQIRVGVLMGGKSIEREVSFNSGRTVCDHLDAHRYDIVPLFQDSHGKLFILPWRFLHRGKISDFEHRLNTEAEQITWDSLKERVDFIYNAMNGRYGEDGSLQGLLEILGIPYLGSKVYASALGMDKFLQKDFLRMHNITVPRDVRIKQSDIALSHDLTQHCVELLGNADISFPCIIKPRHEGSSLGVTVVKRKEELAEAIKKAAHIDPHKTQDVLIEELIEGMEFTCILYTDQNGQAVAMPPTEIIKDQGADVFDYTQKYMPGRATKFTPARCDAHATNLIQQTCVQVMHALDMQTLVRIDGFLTRNANVVIIDPNSLCGMAPSSFVFCQAAQIGMNHANLINHVIESELRQYKTCTVFSSLQQKEYTWTH